MARRDAARVLDRLALGEVRGVLLPPPDDGAPSAALPAPVLVTTHPSAMLRIEDAADRERGIARLVADLRTAASGVAGRRSETERC